MIIRITDHGTDIIKPNTGETVEECVFKEFGIDDFDQVEYFNPKYITRAMDIPNVAMFVKRFSDGEPINNVARFITGSPSRYAIRGTAVVVGVNGEGWNAIPDKACNKICTELNEFLEKENA